jgi:hypothetical protein
MKRPKALIDSLIIYAANQVYHALDRKDRKTAKEWKMTYDSLMRNKYDSDAN